MHGPREKGRGEEKSRLADLPFKIPVVLPVWTAPLLLSKRIVSNLPERWKRHGGKGENREAWTVAAVRGIKGEMGGWR